MHFFPVQLTTSRIENQSAKCDDQHQQQQPRNVPFFPISWTTDGATVHRRKSCLVPGGMWLFGAMSMHDLFGRFRAPSCFVEFLRDGSTCKFMRRFTCSFNAYSCAQICSSTLCCYCSMQIFSRANSGVCFAHNVRSDAATDSAIQTPPL